MNHQTNYESLQELNRCNDLESDDAYFKFIEKMCSEGKCRHRHKCREGLNCFFIGDSNAD